MRVSARWAKTVGFNLAKGFVLFGARFSDDRVTQRSMRVSAGLFVLRYVSSSAEGKAPTVVVYSDEGSGVEIVTHDRSETGVMASPGEAVVVRASHTSSLMVKIYSATGDSGNHAHLVFERVSATGLGAASLNASLAEPATYLDGLAGRFEILAHVARRGDVLAADGEWICGPHLPMAIEGIQIRWPGRPAGADISVSATQLVRGRSQPLPQAPVGEFVGSRGKAIPLAGITLSMSAALAARHVFECEALFLGTQVVRRSGALVELSGPTGLEPLVGLRIGIMPAIRSNAAADAARIEQAVARRVKPLSLETAIPSAGSSGRVRVFRTSRARQPINQQ
jgi:hypothetical protein